MDSSLPIILTFDVQVIIRIRTWMRGWMTLYFFIIVPRTYMHGFITSHYLDDLYATAAWPYTTRRQHRH